MQSIEIGSRAIGFEDCMHTNEG